MKKILFFTLAFILLLSLNIKASHIAGAEITYDCLGNNRYLINLRLYWDCTGGFDPGNPQTVTLSSTCGNNLSLTLPQTNVGGTDISQLCPTAISTCSGGTNPGYNMNIYSDTVTLPPCDTWTMSWYNCCRNAAITNLSTPSSFGMYAQAKLNSVTDTCNHSPYFTSQPLPFLCVNQAFCYNFGVVEQDGDSLYYSLINAMDNGGTLLAYNAGYTPTAPIPGITINPNTGQIGFTPTNVGNYVVVVQVDEYTPSGSFIGSVMRDIQFVVYNCNNQTVGCTDGNVTGLTGTAAQTGPYSVEMCEGSSFTFSVTYTDPNAGDSLTIVSNLATVLPGSTITSSGNNPLTATISWTAPGGSANTNTSFSITIKDNACPVPGQQTFVYVIKVLPRTLGGSDKIICGNQTASLHGTGGSTFNWSVISGPLMVIGTNFSCNPCTNPIASPISTTVYEVVSNLGGTCVNKDTVTVTVVPDFFFVTTTSTDTLCLQQLVQLNITGSPAGAYSYLWSPSTYLSSTIVANPTANVTVPGTYNYIVKITSPLGCLKKDTATVTILPPIRTKVSRDTILCGSQSTPLHATGGSTFVWSVLSGPAIAVGTNFSCNPCANAVATPTATTTYLVTSNLNGTCINKDTVTVTVVPDFTNTITQSSTVTCLAQAPIQINVTTAPPGTYSYLWAATNSLNNYAIPNPLANITTPGTHVYVVSVTSSQGCVKKDSISITVTPSYPPNPIAYGYPTPICAGDTVHLGVTFGNSVPSVCGINPVGCSAPLIATVGTGTTANTSTTWPAPYGNWYTSAKQQFLFKATELNAAGVTGGKIDQLDFNVTSIPTGAITIYHQYTINMGCTNLNALTASWVGSLFNVYTPKNHTVTTGWNAHPFDNAFEWDGVSNVVVEICFNEGPPNPNYTNSCISPNTLTSFISCLYKYSDQNPMCPATSVPQTSSNRPNVKLHYCGGSPDSSRYTYSWLPSSGGVLHPHNQTTGAILPGTTNYAIVVTDTVSGCLDTAHVIITANNPTTLHVTASHDTTICPGGAIATLIATGAPNYIWSPSTGLSSTNTAITHATPTATTTYTVTGTGHCTTGPSKDSVKVSVFTGTPLHINAGIDHEVCGTDPFNLIATSSGGYGGNTYKWTIISPSVADSIQNSTSALAFVIPTNDNTNTYQVTVKDTCGNTATDQVVVIAHVECKLTIPNVFTPNGDGTNDNFIVKGTGIKIYSAVIYNRWGIKVFESTDITKPWDGKNVEDGTYYYVITAESAAGKMFDEKGFVERISK